MQRGLPSGLPPPSLLLRLSQLVSHGIVSTSIHPSFSPPSSLSPSAPPPRHRLREPRGDRERERERERKGTPSMDRSIDPHGDPPRSSALSSSSPQFLSSLRTLLSSFVPLFVAIEITASEGPTAEGLLPILCKFICMIRQYFVSLFI